MSIYVETVNFNGSSVFLLILIIIIIMVETKKEVKKLLPYGIFI